jgi:hypothetical protein
LRGKKSKRREKLEKESTKRGQRERTRPGKKRERRC